jgi:ABC-type sulfate transport system permease component
MIARPLEWPAEAPRPAPRTVSRAARAAVQARRNSRTRARYRALVTIGSVVSVLTLIVVVYLALLANVTRMTYELQTASDKRTALIEENGRLDDRIAGLESRERLSRLAASMGMHDSQTFAEIPLPVVAAERPSGPTILSWLK